jgi:hypothetical protein
MRRTTCLTMTGSGSRATFDGDKICRAEVYFGWDL